MPLLSYNCLNWYPGLPPSRSPPPLQVKGPFVVQEYFKLGKPATDAQGWFTTGGEWAECSSGDGACGRMDGCLL